MAKIIAGLVVFLGFIGMIFIISALMALPVMWLWNWLIPTIFGLSKITVFQAFGLTLLCSILFKSNTENNS